MAQQNQGFLRLACASSFPVEKESAVDCDHGDDGGGNTLAFLGLVAPPAVPLAPVLSLDCIAYQCYIISNMEAQRSFGHALRMARLRVGLTQVALAKKAGLHQPDVALLESNRRPCGRDVAERIADALRLNARRRRDFIDAALQTTVSGVAVASRTALERCLRREVIRIDFEVPIGRGERADMIATTKDGRRWVIELKVRELKQQEVKV